MVCKTMAIKCAGNFFSALLIVCSGCFQTALAGGLTISPVLLELDALHKAVTVTLRNGGDTPLAFQSSALIWQQIDGVDQYSPTDAVLVAPAIIEIPAQSSQVFRVTLRQFVPGFIEQSYRLLLEDVSRPQSDNERPAVALRLIHSLPLLVAPAGKTTVELRWSPCPAQDKPDCVRITNVGNRHVKVKTITISGPTESSSGADDWQQQLDAGKEHVSYTVPVKRKDGIMITLELHAKRIDWDGIPAHIVLADDVTEREHQKAQIARYVQQLEGSMQATLEAVSNMVEMRDPYTAGHERRVGIIASDIAK